MCTLQSPSLQQEVEELSQQSASSSDTVDSSRSDEQGHLELERRIWVSLLSGVSFFTGTDRRALSRRLKANSPQDDGSLSSEQDSGPLPQGWAHADEPDGEVDATAEQDFDDALPTGAAEEGDAPLPRTEPNPFAATVETEGE